MSNELPMIRARNLDGTTVLLAAPAEVSNYPDLRDRYVTAAHLYNNPPDRNDQLEAKAELIAMMTEMRRRKQYPN